MSIRAPRDDPDLRDQSIDRYQGGSIRPPDPVLCYRPLVWAEYIRPSDITVKCPDSYQFLVSETLHLQLSGLLASPDVHTRGIRNQ